MLNIFNQFATNNIIKIVKDNRTQWLNTINDLIASVKGDWTLIPFTNFCRDRDRKIEFLTECKQVIERVVDKTIFTAEDFIKALTVADRTRTLSKKTNYISAIRIFAPTDTISPIQEMINTVNKEIGNDKSCQYTTEFTMGPNWK
jgi:hypothetical protein